MGRFQLLEETLSSTMSKYVSASAPTLVRLFFVAATLTMAATAFVSSSSSTKATTTSSSASDSKTRSSTTSANRKLGSTEIGPVAGAKYFPSLFSSCLPSASTSSTTVRRRDPSFVEKQRRRLTVFSVAAGVFFEYKWAQRKANRIKKKLGLSLDDPDSDDHPDVTNLWSHVHERNSRKLLSKIERLQGFWVKVGQYLSTRADIMPPEYIHALSSLQDACPAKSWEETWTTIQEELGEDAMKNFDSIDQEPLSTASLAQVHRATIKDDQNGGKNGLRDVVIKVQHRGVASLMMLDMENLRLILQMLAYTDSDLDFNPVIREYNMEVAKELDFRTEAENMKEISDLLRISKIQAIIPDTVPGLVTERVLVMDFCEGFPVKDTHLLDEFDVNRELLLERVCAAWAVQMHVGG